MIEGAASTGKGGRSFTTVKWTVSSGSTGPTLNSKVLTNIEKASTNKNLNLVLQASDFENYFGIVYFSLKLTNWFGNSDEKTIEIRR